MPFDNEDFHSGLEFADDAAPPALAQCDRADPVGGGDGKLIPRRRFTAADVEAILRPDFVLRFNAGPGPAQTGLIGKAQAYAPVSPHAETGPRMVSFAEAAERLQGVFDLDAARDAAVEQQERWGLVQALIDAGVVTDINSYRAIFDQVQFTEAGLRAVQKKIEQGEPQRAVFNPGGLTLPRAFKILFIKAGIPYWENTYPLNNLGAVRYVRPDQIEDLANLDTLSYDAQFAALAAAYKKASPLSVGRSTVLFTPDQREVTATGKSAVQHMQSGTQAVDPMTDFIRWRAQVDTALNGNPESYADELKEAFANRTIDDQLPDRINVTQYPSFVLPDGHVLAFGWDLLYRMVNLSDCHPASPSRAFGDFGPRLALR